MPTDSDELLIESLQKWADLYGKKLKEKTIDVWLQIFRSVKPDVLSKALMEVTKKAERMPTPGLLTKAIQDVYDRYPDTASGTEIRFGDPACKTCMGTGFELFTCGERSKKAKRCKCWQEQPREFKSDLVFTADKDGISCAIDGKTEDVLYRAPDCTEGREFLKYLRNIAKAKAIPKEMTAKQVRQERNRQVAALGAVE